jgi:hypothetical protein
MPPTECKPTISPSDESQTHTLDRVATRTGIYKIILVFQIVFADHAVISKQFKTWITQNILKLLYKEQYIIVTGLNQNKDSYKYDRFALLNQNSDFIYLFTM